MIFFGLFATIVLQTNHSEIQIFGYFFVERANMDLHVDFQMTENDNEFYGESRQQQHRQ